MFQLINMKDFLITHIGWCTLCCSFQRDDCHIWLVDRMKFASLEANLGGDQGLLIYPILLFSLPLSRWSNNMTETLLTGTLRLDLILSLFFYCCGCPRYWGRQQVARVSSIQSPRLSVQWIDATKAAHLHVSLNTLRTGLFRSSSFSGVRDGHALS